jgi:hypothetical protein
MGRLCMQTCGVEVGGDMLHTTTCGAGGFKPTTSAYACLLLFLLLVTCCLGWHGVPAVPVLVLLCLLYLILLEETTVLKIPSWWVGVHLPTCACLSAYPCLPLPSVPSTRWLPWMSVWILEPNRRQCLVPSAFLTFLLFACILYSSVPATTPHAWVLNTAYYMFCKDRNSWEQMGTGSCVPYPACYCLLPSSALCLLCL